MSDVEFIAATIDVTEANKTHLTFHFFRFKRNSFGTSLFLNILICFRSSLSKYIIDFIETFVFKFFHENCFNYKNLHKSVRIKGINMNLLMSYLKYIRIFVQ